MSAIVTTQADCAARLLALASVSASHLSHLHQHQFRIEDREHRSRINNIRLKGIPETTSGIDLKLTVITMLHLALGKEASPIDLDRVHRVGGADGRSWYLP